jgi:hypothetical protein
MLAMSMVSLKMANVRRELAILMPNGFAIHLRVCLLVRFGQAFGAALGRGKQDGLGLRGRRGAAGE